MISDSIKVLIGVLSHLFCFRFFFFFLFHSLLKNTPHFDSLHKISFQIVVHVQDSALYNINKDSKEVLNKYNVGILVCV